MNQRIRKILLIALVVLVAVFVLSALFIVADGLSDNLHSADVAIIPGNTVNPDGLPSPRLKSRLDRAVRLYNQGLVQNLIASGGLGSEGFDEAEVMKRYLIDQSVPPIRLTELIAPTGSSPHSKSTKVTIKAALEHVAPAL